jgi:hypothetical protein
LQGYKNVGFKNSFTILYFIDLLAKNYTTVHYCTSKTISEVDYSKNEICTPIGSNLHTYRDTHAFCVGVHFRVFLTKDLACVTGLLKH